ncbi:hypothetical protein CRENPOLYSF1_1020005 [Crenothrix polyspora]|uniref:Uncharacterized protein n=1 Tax=Crenothrix polyspora TaxID=360316 RepID=A0A1R4GZA9_9GAMM|nr:hypothetical protein CRENPOLYSF1_1020005 [Crenothrix polyspora]
MFNTVSVFVSPYLKESHHEFEFRNRTHTVPGDGYINFDDTEIFKLFRRHLFNCYGCFRAYAHAA